MNDEFLKEAGGGNYFDELLCQAKSKIINRPYKYFSFVRTYFGISLFSQLTDAYPPAGGQHDRLISHCRGKNMQLIKKYGSL